MTLPGGYSDGTCFCTCLVSVLDSLVDSCWSVNCGVAPCGSAFPALSSWPLMSFASPVLNDAQQRRGVRRRLRSYMSDRLVFVGGHGPAQPGIMDPLCAPVHCTGFAGYKRRGCSFLPSQYMGEIQHCLLCSGQGAALAGGTTMIIDFALPVNGDIAKGFKRYQDVSKRAVMDYGLHMAITDWNDKVCV